MKICVCIKRVPHTATKLRLAPGESDSPSRSIQTQGVEFTISPYDELALAEADRLNVINLVSRITHVAACFFE